MLYTLLFIVTVLLAYTNGANDNFKGVATLFGSGTANYRRAIAWATIATFAGCICAIFYADQLVKNFSGKGLVPDALTASPHYLLAVAFGAGLTVLLATQTGFPISTTHALTGALVGTGLVAAGRDVNFQKLGGTFIIPLLLSPLIAVAVGGVCYFVLHGLRSVLKISEETCICADPAPSAVPIPIPVLVGASQSALAGQPLISMPVVTVDSTANCIRQYKGALLGVRVQSLVDGAHYLSAGAVSFARGLNDSPKIVAMMLLIPAVDIKLGLLAIAVGMAVGGLLNAKKVAETMSKKITPMNSGQGFTANLVTASIVIAASLIGKPVSTTHVSVGSIFGMGMITKQGNVKVATQIGLSWLLTLPIAAALGAVMYLIVKALI
jgi:PiT family inorganic phosphate transporter